MKNKNNKAPYWLSTASAFSITALCVIIAITQITHWWSGIFSFIAGWFLWTTLSGIYYCIKYGYKTRPE